MDSLAEFDAPDSMSVLEDRELVAGCLEGRSEAWEALIIRYKTLIYSIAVKSGLLDDDAADVFQTMCLILLEKLPALRNHDRLAPWLIKTTKRACWRARARDRRQADVFREEDDSDLTSDIKDESPLIEEELLVLERQQIVRQSVAALPERCRKLLTMLFYQKEELSYVDIARRMNMPTASVGPNRARCLEKLKVRLEGKL